MQVTTPYAHSQNGKIECFIQTLEDGFQTLPANPGLPMSFWGDAVLTMVYIRNCVPTSVLPSNTTPFEDMEHSKPDLSHLRVWGCQCFVTIPPELRTKGGPHHFEAIFVGYDENQLGWHVQDLHRKCHFSHDVIFNKLVPGHLSSSPSFSSSPSPLTSSSSPSPPMPIPPSSPNSLHPQQSWTHGICRTATLHQFLYAKNFMSFQLLHLTLFLRSAMTTLRSIFQYLVGSLIYLAVCT